MVVRERAQTKRDFFYGSAAVGQRQELMAESFFIGLGKGFAEQFFGQPGPRVPSRPRAGIRRAKQGGTAQVTRLILIESDLRKPVCVCQQNRLAVCLQALE
jgi:hypothetical protein